MEENDVSKNPASTVKSRLRMLDQIEKARIALSADTEATIEI